MIVAVGAASWQHFRRGVSSECSVPQRHRCLSAVPGCKRGIKEIKAARKKVMENVEEEGVKGGKPQRASRERK